MTKSHIDLVCDGIDTISSITINGQKTATTENQFVKYRFSVKDALKEVSCSAFDFS